MMKKRIKELNNILFLGSDCLDKLNSFKRAYNRTDDLEIRLYMEEGFRGYIKHFQELIKKYILIMNYNVFHSKDRHSYDTILQKHYDAGNLSIVSKEFLMVLRQYRNDTAHEYEMPPFENIFNFFYSNIAEFQNFLTCVRFKRDELQKQNLLDSSNESINDITKDELDKIKIVIELLHNGVDPEVLAKSLNIDIDIINKLK